MDLATSLCNKCDEIITELKPHKFNLKIRNGTIYSTELKGELGKLQFYFRKILLHQQTFLVISVLSNLPWLPGNLKKSPK